MNSEIKKLAEAAGQAAAAERVLLFGSNARGTDRAGSDVDLALVVPDAVSKREALRAAIRATAQRRVAVDFVVITHSAWQSGDSLLAREVKRDGILVYGQ